MSKINLYSDKDTTATSVSNVFIDEYMSDANGEFVKIYLYLLRQLNSVDAGFSLSEIADKFEHTEKDVKRALCYWERMQLLHLDYDGDENLVGIQLKDALSKSSNATQASKQTFSAGVTSASTTANVPDTDDAPVRKSYSADDIKQFTEQEAVRHRPAFLSALPPAAPAATSPVVFWRAAVMKPIISPEASASMMQWSMTGP